MNDDELIKELVATVRAAEYEAVTLSAYLSEPYRGSMLALREMCRMVLAKADARAKRVANAEGVAMDNSQLTPNDLKTVSQFVQEHPNLGTESSHRWHLFIRRQELEAAGAVARRGRRLFIVVPRYVAYMTGEGRAV